MAAVRPPPPTSMSQLSRTTNRSNRAYDWATKTSFTTIPGSRGRLRAVVAVTLEEFMDKMLASFPDATADTDVDGQIVIHTALRLDRVGNVVPLERGAA